MDIAQLLATPPSAVENLKLDHLVEQRNKAERERNNTLAAIFKGVPDAVLGEIRGRIEEDSAGNLYLDLPGHSTIWCSACPSGGGHFEVERPRRFRSAVLLPRTHSLAEALVNAQVKPRAKTSWSLAALWVAAICVGWTKSATIMSLLSAAWTMLRSHIGH